MSKEDFDPAGHCFACRFWHLPEQGDDGECRRRAPEYGVRWPAVGGWDWCGEHEPLVKQTKPAARKRKGRT